MKTVDIEVGKEYGAQRYKHQELFDRVRILAIEKGRVRKMFFADRPTSRIIKVELIETHRAYQTWIRAQDIKISWGEALVRNNAIRATWKQKRKIKTQQAAHLIEAVEMLEKAFTKRKINISIDTSYSSHSLRLTLTPEEIQQLAHALTRRS